MSRQSTVFSTLLTKEISVAKNIRDRQNRQNVQRLLTIVQQRSDISGFTNGVFIFVGITEYKEEIIEYIEPDVKLDIFKYSCANKFITEHCANYIDVNICGTLVFANGNDCYGYQFSGGTFVKKFALNGNLVKRHNKGGYSANRFARIAEESRHVYVTRIIDRLKDLPDARNIWMYGSDEIVNMVMAQCPSHIMLNNGGFLQFNAGTIQNTKYWISKLSAAMSAADSSSYNKKYKEIAELLATNVDQLDFDPENRSTMKYFLSKTSAHFDDINYIPLASSSEWYSQLVMFDYIGVKFYAYDIDTAEDEAADEMDGSLYDFEHA